MFAFTARVVLFVVVGLGLSVVRGADEKVGDEIALAGEWKPISLEKRGNPGPEEVVNGLRLSFTVDVVTIFKAGETTGSKAKFKLDATKSPKTIDLVPQDGPKQGKTLPGIYVIENGQLKICCQESEDDPRPTEFKTTATSNATLLVLERVKGK